jgi:hypothetical protein
MSDEAAVMPSETDSIVLGAAESAARIHGLRLAAPAKDFLLMKSVPTLEVLREKDELSSRRSEIERNTSDLIDYIVKNVKQGSTGPEITYSDLVEGISLFCRLFPHFIPFCVNAE